MAYDGNGTFLPLPAPTFPAVTGSVIYADYFNLNLGNIHSGLSAALPRDGQAAMTGNLRMAGFKVREVAPGTAAGDLVEWGQWTDTFLNATYQVLNVPNLAVDAVGIRVPNLNWVTAYVTGVVTPMAADTATRSLRAGDAYTGEHDYTLATALVATKAAGTATTEAASTAFVQADFAQKFPGYTAPVMASSVELNYLVGVTSPIQPQLSNQVAGPIHAAVAKPVPAAADELGFTNSADAWALSKLTFADLQAWASTFALLRAGDTLEGALEGAPSVTLASAVTTDIGAANSNTIVVTGVETITALGVAADGARRVVTFLGELTLSHDAVSLILPGAANLLTTAGDVAEFLSLGGGNWRCIGYQSAVSASATVPVLSSPELHTMFNL